MNLPPQLVHLAAALAIGLMIGLERGWKLRGSQDGQRVAGIRTFSLLALIGGLAGLLGAVEQQAVAGALVAGAIGVVAVGYSRSIIANGKPDATSAVAAIAAVGLGYAAGFGEPALAVACAAVVTLMLALRTEVHGWVDKLDEADIKAFARYAVISLAVFPFLPEGRYGPYDAWEPRTLWLVVVVITGLSFAGYLVNRFVGVRRGTIATALIGGAYSSTAVTHSLAQAIGAGRGGAAENTGIALASGVMYLRVIVLTAILADSLLPNFIILVAPPLVATFALSLLLYRQSSHSAAAAAPGNPIALVPALSFVAFVAATAVAARWAEGRFGEQGIALLLLIMGSMDVDAAIVTAGGLQPGTIAPALAALAIGGTILANMSVKLGITLVYGKRAARPAALALAASMAVLTVSLAVGYLRL